MLMADLRRSNAAAVCKRRTCAIGLSTLSFGCAWPPLACFVALAAGNILIPPTDRARKLADYVRVAVALHFFLAIFLMIGGRYIDGVYESRKHSRSASGAQSN